MIKRREYEDPNSCLNKADLDEPIFVLRGKNKLAPALVRLWANLAALHGCGTDKISEARHLADLMESWGNEFGSKWPD